MTRIVDTFKVKKVNNGKIDKKETFYQQALSFLTGNDFRVLVAGTYALNHYTGMNRPTKDLDLFCTAGDYPKIVKALTDEGFKVRIIDERWLAKIEDTDGFIDLIFGNVPGFIAITDDWFATKDITEIGGIEVPVTKPTELYASKIFRLSRSHFDGIDLAFLTYHQHRRLSWKRILELMENHWELLFLQIILYRYLFPFKRKDIPDWLVRELNQRFKNQIKIPAPEEKVTRGMLVAPQEFHPLISQWQLLDMTQHQYLAENEVE